MRSKLVAVVSISSNLLQWVLMGGLILYATSQISIVLSIGIALFAVTTLFACVTLPVEYDASNRALVWLKERDMVMANEYDAAKDDVEWAAGTYVGADR